MAVRPETSLSLFSGIGALDLAVAGVFPGCRTLAYVEGEGYAAAVLAARMASGDLDDAPVWSDIRTFPGRALRDRVDLVVGGFPCQDISLAGAGDGIEGGRSGLFFTLRDVVRDVRPRYVLLENVAAITLRGLDAVLGALADLGFDAEWGCLRASDIGASHGRNRWWCLAWDRELLADAGQRAGVGWASEPWRGSLDGAPASWSSEAVGGSAVADAVRLQRTGQGRGLRDGGRVREILQVVGHAERLSGQRWGDARDVACPCGAPESQAWQRERGRHPADDPGAGLWPGFPPGPDDRDGWRRFLAEYPDLAPATERAVRRGADGASTRVDRLRGLGNAVVPQQAEAALRLLWLRAFGSLP